LTAGATGKQTVFNRNYRRIISRASRYLAIAGLGFVLAGCAESQRPVATGKGSVRGYNAIATAPELFFLNEERSLGNVNFRGVLGFRDWDDLSYTFNFDIFYPGASDTERVASQFIDVLADTEYTLVITGTLDNPAIIWWEAPERTFDGSETVFDNDFAHMAPQFGQVDVYYAPEGTAPAAGMEVGTLSFGERIDYVEFQPGDYVLTLTAPGDPSTVLFQSAAFTRAAADRTTFIFTDPDPSVTSPVGVDLVTRGGGIQRVYDINSPPQIRVLHVGFGTPNFDGYLDENLANLTYPDVGFREVTPYADATDDVMPLTLTPVGDTGTTLFTTDVQRVVGTYRTIAIYGDNANIASRPLLDEARPLSTYPVVRITHLSNNLAEGLDIYEVDPGTELTDDVFPRFPGALVGISTGYFAGGTGMREFVVTLPGEKTAVSTPLDLDLATGDIVDIMIIDTADPAVVELLVYDSR